MATTGYSKEFQRVEVVVAPYQVETKEEKHRRCEDTQLTEAEMAVSRRLLDEKLGPEERADAITALREKELDIPGSWGGIVGTGALDAVTRRASGWWSWDWSGTPLVGRRSLSTAASAEQLDFRLS
jgi:hypothetical protein